ncbi:MAG: hypothetical protein ACHQZS_09555 [Candidatus Binatales bacterium]
MFPNQVAAVSSLVTEPCTATAGNSVLACSATGDFVVGQPIFVPLAAAPNSLNAGNGAGVGPTISAINYVRLPGGVAPHSGSTEYCYAVTTFDANLAESAPGPTLCTGATEPSPLGGDQSEQPVWPIVTGATQYGIYGCSGSGCTPHQIATSLQTKGFIVSSVPSTGWQDFGLPPSTRTAPGSALNGVLYANVTAIVPNVSITVSVAPSVSGPVTIGPESCGAINAALSADSPQGGTVQLPAGQYRCAKMLDIANQTTLAGHCAFTIYPNGAVNPNYAYGSAIVWGGPDGAITAREWTGMNEHSECISYNANAMNLTGTAPVAITQMVIDGDVVSGSGPRTQNNYAKVYGGGFYNGYVAIREGGAVTVNGQVPKTDVSTNYVGYVEAYSASPSYAFQVLSSNAFQNQFDHVTTTGGVQGFTTENGSPGIVIENSNFNCPGGGNAINLDSGVTVTIRGTDVENNCTNDLYTAPTSASNSATGSALALLEGNSFYGPGGIKLDAAGLVISIGNVGTNNSSVWQADAIGATVFTIGDSIPWSASVNGGAIIDLKNIAQDLAYAFNPNRLEIDASLDTWGKYGNAIDFMPWANPASGWPFRIGEDSSVWHGLSLIPGSQQLVDWQASHSYSNASITPKAGLTNGLYVFTETGACTSGTLASEPQWPRMLHATVSDNTCTWSNQGQLFPADTGKGLVLSNTGLYRDGGAVKHGTVTTGAIEASSTATVTLNWSTAFPDTNYTPDCSVIDTGGNLTLVDINGWNAGSLTAAVKNNDSGNRHTGTLACHAFHN